MTILTITVSITAPALANFFRGRTLDSEARRLLALTRHGQSRAASEGIPMELWVDTAQGTFGLEAQPSYEESDRKAVELTLDGDIRLEPVYSSASPTAGSSGTARTVSGGNGAQLVSHHPGLPKVRFLPDGSIDQTSPQVLRLTGRDGSTIWLAQSRTRLNYEIRTRIN